MTDRLIQCYGCDNWDATSTHEECRDCNEVSLQEAVRNLLSLHIKYLRSVPYLKLYLLMEERND